MNNGVEKMGETVRMKNLGRWVKALIKDFIERSPEILSGTKKMKKPGKTFLWDFQAVMILSIESIRKGNMLEPFTGLPLRYSA